MWKRKFGDRRSTHTVRRSVLAVARRRVLRTHRLVRDREGVGLREQRRHHHVSGQVLDWEGGTRIGETLASFNRLWGRRVLGQGAVVLLITDGLERAQDEADLQQLEKEIERLHKSCRRLIWLNPLLRFDGFEPRAAGVRIMLPHVDDFRAVHSLDSLSDLCSVLGAARGR